MNGAAIGNFAFISYNNPNNDFFQNANNILVTTHKNKIIYLCFFFKPGTLKNIKILK